MAYYTNALECPKCHENSLPNFEPSSVATHVVCQNSLCRSVFDVDFLSVDQYYWTEGYKEYVSNQATNN